ncbi:MAG TPA: S8 family peptidase [Anaerolineales bacterium]|nr:S8 family peptidase [Anaerolineales bacterium]
MKSKPGTDRKKTNLFGHTLPYWFGTIPNLVVYFVVALLLLLAFALTSGMAGAEAVKPAPPSAEEDIPGLPTNRLIVKYTLEAEQNSRVSPASEDRIRSLGEVAGEELEYVRATSGGEHVLQVQENFTLSELEALAEELESHPDVEYAEPDYIMMPVVTPDDTYYGSHWHYFGTYGINLPGAWDIHTGSTTTYIAVIDTGIVDHADLAGRWVGGYDFIADTMVANDGNGRDSNPRDPGDWITSAESASGYFFGCDVSNSSWHGTHVAGTIGAIGNNSTGVTGINWNSPIVPVRVLGKCGGYLSDVSDGMRWAAGLSVSGVPANPHPARVLNLSLGGAGSCSTTYQNAINAVNAAGAIVVVAAGNSNLDASNFQPANCSGVITVAATSQAGNKASYSNYGSVVEISAPGNSIFSTYNSGTTTPASDSYAYLSGTSMATPHVAGVISLLLSIDPTLTYAEILSILQSTALAFPSGSSCTTSICGSGILNAAAAVNSLGAAPQLPDLIVSSVVVSPATPDVDETFDVIITIKNQGGATGPVTIYRDIYVDLDPLTTLDPGTGCPVAGDYYRSDFFTNLDPGKSDTKTITITGGFSDRVQLWAYVDSRCLIPEIGE